MRVAAAAASMLLLAVAVMSALSADASMVVERVESSSMSMVRSETSGLHTVACYIAVAHVERVEDQLG